MNAMSLRVCFALKPETASAAANATKHALKTTARRIWFGGFAVGPARSSSSIKIYANEKKFALEIYQLPPIWNSPEMSYLNHNSAQDDSELRVTSAPISRPMGRRMKLHTPMIANVGNSADELCGLIVHTRESHAPATMGINMRIVLPVKRDR